MSTNEQLNALTRIAFLMIIVILILNISVSLLLIPITLLILVILYKNKNKIGFFNSENFSNLIVNKQNFGSNIESDIESSFDSNSSKSVLNTNFIVKDVPVAFNVDDDDIKDNIKVNFKHDLFRDVQDLWERDNSQRQFFSLPNHGIPSNQKEFALWLYGNNSNCKNDTTKCLRVDQLIYNRDLVTPRI